MRQGFDRGVVVGVVLLAGMMLGIAATSFVNTRRLWVDADRVDHSHKVIDAVGSVQADTRHLQADLRGYLVTGFPEALPPYEASRTRLRASARRLADLTADDADQATRAAAVGREIEAGVAGFDGVAQVRGRPDGHAAVVALARERGPRSFVDPLLETLAEMERAERDRLTARQVAARAAYSRSIGYGFAAAVLGLVAVGLFVRTLLAAGRRRELDSARLRDQRQLLDATLTSIGDGVVTTDADGRVTLLNVVAEKLTGWASADARGRPLEEVFRIVNETTREPVENPAVRALKEGVIVGLANHTILIAKDGVERPIDDSAAPIRSADAVGGAVLVFRDITDRKKAEELVRDARVRLEATLAAGEVATWTWDIKADRVVADRNLARLFGASAADAQGGPIAAFTAAIHPDDRGPTEGLIRRALATREAYEARYRVRDGAGGYRSLVARGRAEYDADGTPARLPGVVVDITRQAAAEAALRQTTERLQLLMTAARDYAVILTDPAGVVVEWLAGAEAITGYAAGEAVGRSAEELIFTPEDRAAGAAAEEMTTADAVGRAEDRRWHVRRDGTAFFADGVTVPLRDDAGTLRGYGKVFQDVTARVRAAEALARVTAESEQRKRLYETILSNTPDFMYVFSLDHRVVYANAALVQMWGCEPIGKTFLEIGYEPWHAEMHGREIDQVRATKQPIRGEVPFHGTLGRRIYDYIFVPVFGADGEVEAVAGTTRDVTDRKAMEDALRDADRKKDDFLALLAHELRNPLAPIRNGLQVIRLATDRAVREQAQGMMDRQLSHMVRLVDDLLEVSRINRNKLELRRGRIALADVIESAVETARPAVDEAGHALTVTLPPTPVVLDADLTRLAQVFSNLLTNSAKYTPRGGTITLSAAAAGGTVVVTVRDTGIGIPADALPRIFDMFSQVDRTIERTTGGLGIGLALVKGLVEMHGGTVTADSDGPGRGSAFTVTLPTAGDHPPPAAAATPEEKPATPAVRRVLVVDDNRDGAESLSLMLGLLGHVVEMAHDGLQAVEMAERFRPNVILMDVGMPRLNGLDATRRIREQEWGKGITIIALTGWGQEADRERSREAGCDGHLVKPVDPTALAGLLGRSG